ncbi:hypothetical protein B296_00054996 [Ensete ventricosum]|uniref:Uncharacterized protein n=1 Tax=Ensete ventricosum TaxID=4639 RepID=A0A426X1B1_ENSVE|nr:hypothetical protein B296_00054996 [Ensete ventricosum]
MAPPSIYLMASPCTSVTAPCNSLVLISSTSLCCSVGTRELCDAINDACSYCSHRRVVLKISLSLDHRRLVEIVYPCISDPDGEDEGGQTSSSLAVSTRWISAAKLLQSDLVTPPIIRISQIHKGRIILFAKGCTNSIFPFCAAAPAQAVAALAHRQPPLRPTSCPQAVPLWASPLYRLAVCRRYPYGLVAGKQHLVGWLLAAGVASARR